MSEAGQIYQLIPDAMSDIGAVGKDKLKESPSGSYRYRSLDATMSALKPILTKHRIFTVPEVTEQTREMKESYKGAKLNYSILKVRYRFYAPDGSYVEVTTIGEGMDSSDKASNKAMSAAYKYALCQLFCIPTEDLLDDGDAEDPMEQGDKPADTKGSKQTPLSQSSTARKNVNVIRTEPQKPAPNPDKAAGDRKEKKQPASDAANRIVSWCKAHNLGKDQFTAFWQALGKANVIKYIPFDQMTEEDCDALFAAIQSNFMEE